MTRIIFYTIFDEQGCSKDITGIGIVDDSGYEWKNFLLYKEGESAYQNQSYEIDNLHAEYLKEIFGCMIHR